MKAHVYIKCEIKMYYLNTLFINLLKKKSNNKLFRP